MQKATLLVNGSFIFETKISVVGSVSHRSFSGFLSYNSFFKRNKILLGHSIFAGTFNIFYRRLFIFQGTCRILTLYVFMVLLKPRTHGGQLFTVYFCNPLDGGHNQVEDTKKGNHLLLCIEENKDRYLIAKGQGHQKECICRKGKS